VGFGLQQQEVVAVAYSVRDAAAGTFAFGLGQRGGAVHLHTFLTMPDAGLSILFEDNHCLALVKPAGLSTQAPPGLDSLEARAKDYLRQRHGKKGRVYLGIPHRLDRPVSGVVLFARQTRSAQRLAEQFQQHQVAKAYWAAVEGQVEPAEGTWEDWLAKMAGQARSVPAAPGSPGAKKAVLSYRRFGAIPDGTLLELTPETGRMHQLRVQAALRGWPIRGDSLYGARIPFEPAHGRERAIALHARRLVFLHPVRFEPITLIAPLPAWWHAWDLVTTLLAEDHA
jgi:23S rRNA pseudouridine1911/1915/1917 synthase